MRLGLRGRFVAFVSAIVIAFGVVLTALSVRAQNERLRHELEDRGKLLTTVLAANTTDALAMLEVRELRRMIAEARDQENVLDAVAFDEEGRVLTDGTVVNPRRHELIPEAALRHVVGSEALLVEFGADLAGRRTLHPARFLARRFAAKEALAKAYGTGFSGGLTFRDIAVSHDAAGKPVLVLAGRAAELQRELGIGADFVSISDEREYAVAFVTVLKSER